MPSPRLWSPDNVLQVISQCGSDPSSSHTSPLQATSIQETHFPGCYKFKDRSAGYEDSESEDVPGEESSPILARGAKSRKELCPVPHLSLLPTGSSRKQKHWSCWFSCSGWEAWKDRMWREGNYPQPLPDLQGGHLVTREAAVLTEVGLQLSWACPVPQCCTGCEERVGAWQPRLVPCKDLHWADRPQG